MIKGGIDVFESKVAKAEAEIVNTRRPSERFSYMSPIALSATMGIRPLHICVLSSKGILMRPAALVARKSRTAIRN